MHYHVAFLDMTSLTTSEGTGCHATRAAAYAARREGVAEYGYYATRDAGIGAVEVMFPAAGALGGGQSGDGGRMLCLVRPAPGAWADCPQRMDRGEAAPGGHGSILRRRPAE